MTEKGTTSKFDDLTPEEVALLVFTTPHGDVTSARDHVVVTSKRSYIWAIGVAQAVRKKPNLAADEAISHLDAAISWYAVDLKRHFDWVAPRGDAFVMVGDQVFYTFARLAGILDTDRPWSVLTKAERALCSLESKGLVRDPLSKRVAGIAVSVLMTIPVSFTERTEHGEMVNRRIEAATWSYEETNDKGTHETHVNVNVAKIAKAILEQFGSRVEMKTGELERGTNDHTAQELGFALGGLPPRYGGIEQSQIEALKRLQMLHGLEPTGYPDPATRAKLPLPTERRDMRQTDDTEVGAENKTAG
jgi:Putative peptidoglycan binding domain